MKNRFYPDDTEKAPEDHSSVQMKNESENPLDELERKERSNIIMKAIDSLPIKQKTAFVLAEIEGLPYAEIAHIEQTTLGTVKSRIHRAKQHLRTVMAPTLGEQ